MNPPTALRLEAPAKLNLSLAVTGRRGDGRHELASAFVLLELADRLLLMPGCSGLRVEGEAQGGVPPDATNLAWLGLIAGLGQAPELACLTLEKRIPAAAGMGGGSSDAAAAWRLGRVWRGATGARADDPDASGALRDGVQASADTASRDEVRALAAIGADVPFFAAATAAAWVTGIGERVEPLPAPEPAWHVILVHPPFGLSTAAVFAALRPDEWSGGRARSAGAQPGPNDLIAAARRLRPELDELIALVTAAGGEPRMTGSGPTLYSLSDDAERASAVAARLERAGLRVTRTRTRSRAASIERLDDEEG